MNVSFKREDGTIPVRTYWIAVVCITLIASLTRLFSLSTLPGLNGDEACEAVKTLELVSGKWQWNPVQPYFGPFYFAITGLWLKLSGLSILTVRLVPALAGIATVIASIFFVGKVYSLRTGLLCGILIALFPAHVAWSRIAFAVSVLPFLNLLIIWLLVLWTEHRRWIFFWGVALVAGLGCNMHPSEFIFVGGVGGAIFFILRRRQWTVSVAQLLGPCLLFLLLSLPVILFWINGAFGKTTAGIQLLDKSFRQFYFVAFFKVLSGEQIYRYFAGSLPEASSWHKILNVMIVVFLVAGIGRCFVQWKDSDILLAVPALFFVVITFWVGAPVHVLGSERYLLPIFYVLPIFIGMAIEELMVNKGRLRTTGFCVLLVITATWATGLYTDYFRHMIQTGGTSAQTFMTSFDHDPKIEAGEHIVSHFTPAEVRIYAESWWLYWPAKFVLGKRYDVHFAPRSESKFNDLFNSESNRKNVFLVFSDSRLDKWLLKNNLNASLEVLNFNKAGGRKLVRMYW